MKQELRRTGCSDNRLIYIKCTSNEENLIIPAKILVDYTITKSDS